MDIQLVFSKLLLLPYFFLKKQSNQGGFMFIKFLLLFGIIILVLIAGNLFILINLNFPMCVFMCLCVYICVHAHVCDGVCACMYTCVCGGQRQLFFRLCLPWFWDNNLPVACQYVAIKPPPLPPYLWNHHVMLCIRPFRVITWGRPHTFMFGWQVLHWLSHISSSDYTS